MVHCRSKSKLNRAISVPSLLAAQDAPQDFISDGPDISVDEHRQRSVGRERLPRNSLGRHPRRTGRFYLGVGGHRPRDERAHYGTPQIIRTVEATFRRSN
jgi:hypothetical protein